MTLNVLTLSTLFPDMSRPNFGVFVERQARELASRTDADVTVIAPVGVPYWPLSLAPQYAALRALPRKERWRELTVYRPIFRILPKIGGRTNVGAMTRAILPLVRRLLVDLLLLGERRDGRRVGRRVLQRRRGRSAALPAWLGF